MSKTENMGANPSQAGSQAENNLWPKQTTLEHPSEAGAACKSNEASEFNALVGPKATKYEPQEARPSTSMVMHEQSYSLSGDLPDNSRTDPSALTSEDVSKSCQTCNISCLQQANPEKNLELRVELRVNERSDRLASLVNEPGENSRVLESSVDNVDMSENPFSGLEKPLNDDTSKHNLTGAEQTLKPGSKDMHDGLNAKCINGGPPEPKHQLGSGGKKSDTSAMVSETSIKGLTPELTVEFNIGTMNGSSASEQVKPSPGDSVMISGTEKSSDDMAKNSGINRLEVTPMHMVSDSTGSGSKGQKISKFQKKSYMSKSLIGSDRVLRSRSEKPKAPERSNNLVDVTSDGEKRRKQKKKNAGKQIVDEYSRIKTHLRYLLNRINYEKSLIAAYSSEGWKGLSLEKLKPEKELQRATSEILRRKLKLRDLFQRLDTLCAEGKLPTSLFDTEGQIDSEDIFCAKCGSKELCLDNDIILCDGACDRGFHQHCLEPPLLNEDIPGDDEGWLCPGCDCKVDCIELVNESQGTNLSLTDSWEKVFPEAAAGDNKDPNFGLPSDDSDDNDYEPEGSSSDGKDQGDESSSDESDFTSASEEFETSANDKQYLGLPSDDSEDDDYDPDAPELDERATEKSSSSDFTSDSEDLDAIRADNMSSGNDEGATNGSPLGDSNGQRSKLGGTKESIDNELSSPLEPGQDTAAPMYEKRKVERLDYKQLYEETYGNATSDSSDEDFNDEISPRKRRKRTNESSPVSSNENSPVVMNRKRNTKKVKQNQTENESSRTGKTRRKLNSEGTSTPTTKSHEGSAATSASGKRAGSSYSRLGEAITQGLHKSFKENQYPNRTTKETLAQELGITVRQVSKWFENARWSFNHPSPRDSRIGKNTPVKITSSPLSSKQSLKSSADVTESSSANVNNSQSTTPKSNRQKSTAPKSRKRKSEPKQSPQAANSEQTVEATPIPPTDPPNDQETKKDGRVLRSRRKSVG